GGLTKSGTGAWNLTGTANTYSGATTITGGILNVTHLADAGSNSSIGTGSTTPTISIDAAGTLQFTGSTTDSTSRAITLTGSGATLDASGSGRITYNGNVTGTATLLNLTGTGDGTIS